MKCYPRHIVNLRRDLLYLLFKNIFNGRFICGPDIINFENKFSQYIGVKFALGVSQARAGLIAILNSLELDKKDEIILASYNFPIIPECISKLGFTPIFVDVDPANYTIDSELIKKKISKKTKAIIVTHTFGNPAFMQPILEIAKENNIKLIEDCAHALGAESMGRKVGSIGDAAIFSFGRGKNMFCYGGGMITTNDEYLYKNLKKYIYLGNFPSSKEILKYIIKTNLTYLLTSTPLFTFITFPVIKILNMFDYDIIEFEKKESLSSKLIKNFNEYPLRLSNIQAVIGLKQLEKINHFNNKTVRNSKLLEERLQGSSAIKLQKTTYESKSIHSYFTIRIENRNLFRKLLSKKGIDASKKSPIMQDCSSLIDFNKFKADCPVSNSIDKEIIEIPNNHLLNEDDINYISESIKAISENYYA